MEIENLVARTRKYDNKLPSKEIAAQVLRNFVDIFSAPEIYIPRRDYSLRNDIEEDIENPNIGMFLYKLSKQAQEEWINWIQSMGIDELEKIFLPEEDYNTFLDVKKDIEKFSEEEIDFNRSLENAICSSTPNFTNCKIADFTLVNYSPSQGELDHRNTVRELESIGRTRELETSPDFSFTDPKRDPDFFNPLSLSNKSRGGYLFKFVSRPYNLTYIITFNMGGERKKIRLNPSNERDYSSIEDINYFWNTVLVKKYPEATDVKISMITPEEKVQFEPDLRLSPGEEPNPSDYKKVNTDSPIGRRLMRSLKENVYHEWKEVSWEFDGELKVALTKTTQKHGVFWIYLHRDEIKSKYSNIRVIYPQVNEIYDKNIHTNKKYIVMYNIRASDHTELSEPFNVMVKTKLNSIVERIKKSGFAFVSKSKHDDSGAIVYSFLRNDLLTNKNRYLERTKDVQ